MRRFWEILKIFVWIIYFSPLVVGLLMIITGNGSANKDSTTPTTKINTIYTPPSNSTPTYSVPIQQTEPVRCSNGAKPPEDAYNEGYDDGYEQGKEEVGMVIVMVQTMMIIVIIMITMKQGTKKAMKAVTMKGFQKVIPNIKMKKVMTNIKQTYRCIYVKTLPMLDKYCHNIKSPFLSERICCEINYDIISITASFYSELKILNNDEQFTSTIP